MDKEKKNLDYDLLLDDWAEEIYALADKHEAKKDESKTGSFQHGYHKGMHDALIMSLVKVSFLENKRTKKYVVEE
ncbi:hypothetical protein ABE073_04565 [Lederbergia citrisecunda]|uniref:hypothetical protein n=1 Tax=Lederbergia citrisecunda TaxID=2833583 RepID=UPI003D2926BB